MSVKVQACAADAAEQPLYARLDAFLATQPAGRDALIPALHKAQDIFGYLPPPVQTHIAALLGLPVSEVLGVVTFYHYFTMQPRGRHTVNVCMGTACYVRGAKKVMETLTAKLGIKLGQTTPDRRFTLSVQRCFGACGLAPVIMIDSEVHGRMTPKKIAATLAKYP
jgi:NADH-quinone oxidoreductase E subunit